MDSSGGTAVFDSSFPALSLCSSSLLLHPSPRRDWGEGTSKSGNLYILPDRTDPTNKADRFHYDYRNRLIKVEHTNNYGDTPPTWSIVVEYYYDGLNRRVKKGLSAGTDVVYLYDGWQVVEEREYDAGDTAWEPRRQFVYGGTYIDEVLIFDKDTDGDGVCDDERYFYAQQANWDVVAVTASDATVVEKVKYDPYGQATVTVQDGQSATGNSYLFQGRRWDSETDLYHFRNRVYSPVLGRFLQRDPEQSHPASSFYSFVGAMPCRLVDPFGLTEEDVCTEGPREGKPKRTDEELTADERARLSGYINPREVKRRINEAGKSASRLDRWRGATGQWIGDRHERYVLVQTPEGGHIWLDLRHVVSAYHTPNLPFSATIGGKGLGYLFERRQQLFGHPAMSAEDLFSNKVGAEARVQRQALFLIPGSPGAFVELYLMKEEYKMLSKEEAEELLRCSDVFTPEDYKYSTDGVTDNSEAIKHGY